MASCLAAFSSARVFSLRAVTTSRVQRRGQVVCTIQPKRNNSTAATSGTHHLSPFYAEKAAPVEEDVDRAYWTDDDVSPVLLQDDESTWQDSNYVDLTLRSYKIVREETQHALQSHFMQQKKEAAAKAPATTESHHTCCAPTPEHTFCCENSIPVAIPLTPLIAHYAILEFAKSPSRLPFRRASRRHLAARPVALFVALSPLLSSRRPLSRPSLLIALPSLSAPFPSPSLSPLPSRRVLSLCSLPVALSLAPPFPSRSLSLLPSRHPLSRPSLPVALSLSAPFPSPSLSPLPSRRALSLRSLPVALSLAPPFPSRSLSLCTLPIALSLAPPFPSRSLSAPPSLSLLPSNRALSPLPSRRALSLRSLPIALSLSAPFTSSLLARLE
ncbi:unnamed protein product [Closterium sp. Naga37s-1]|nr:unnamed protein product [Closterium sp. Naga37s-1]